MTALNNGLVERLTAGDTAAWRKLLSTHGPALLAYAARMLGDRSVAEDVVQDALVSVHRSIGTFEGRCSVRSWLFRFVHNRAIDEIRRRRRFADSGTDDPEQGYFNAEGRWDRPCPGADVGIEDRLDARAMLNAVRNAIDELPHAHREVLLLKEVHGLETSEICEALGISAGNLRIRLHRARKALRAKVIHLLEED